MASKTLKNLSKNLTPTWSMFRLFNAYFFKTIYGPALAFVFPPILLAILGNVLKIEYVFPGIVALTSMFITVQSMPLGMMEMKNSTLFKYIGTSPVSSWKFIAVIISYYIFITFISVFILIFVSMGLFHNKVFTGHKVGLFSGIVTPFGAFSFLFANLMHIALGLSIGIAISTFSKTPQQALTIGLLIIIPSMFLSGMVLTVDIIAQSEAMQWISRFMPFRYTTGNIIVASTPLPQMGDFLSLITAADKSLIFRNINSSTGDIIIKFGGQNWNAHTSREVMELYNASTDNAIFIADNIKDATLFKLIFVQGNVDSMASADNNMFMITKEFGVRKVPDIDKIKVFIQQYLASDLSSGADFISNAQKGEFGWMDLFMKQSEVLFKVYDKVLNVFLPLVLIGSLQYYAAKKFKWSSR